MMRLNVGLSRKVSDNHYGSKGGNVSLEVEVDSAMLGDPSKFMGHMQKLFNLIRNALDEELDDKEPGNHEETKNPCQITPVANHDGEKSSQIRPVRLASEKQLVLIQSLLRKGKIPYQPLLEGRKISSFNELTVQQASQFIGELKEQVG